MQTPGPAELPLPPATWANLIPPILDREYFAAARSHPFRARARVFEPVNAWWLAELALLAYAPPEFQEAQLRRARFRDLDFLVTDNVDCTLAVGETCLLVAFRGTEWDDPRDYLTDLDAALTPFDASGRVHRGFAKAFERIWKTGGLEARLGQLAGSSPDPPRVWFTGHSLGAALATLATSRFDGAAGLFTFGSPRVGDAAFRRAFRGNVWRVVNNNDAVTRVPLDPPYRHVGELHYIDRHGHWRAQPHWRDRAADALLGNLTHVEAVVRRLKSGARGEVLDDGFVDHAPLYYAVHAWNHLVRSSPGEAVADSVRS